MPRHKRALFDSGMHVPLIIHFPENFRGLAPSFAGRTVDRLVNFEDFAPTVLSLAGIESIPEYVRGQAFLGTLDTSPRQYLFGHRDRVDEIMDMARSVRSQDLLYIRNFMPHRGYNQQSAWIDQGEVRKDFYALAEAGTATPAQAQYLNPSRPREELYDCVADPLNLNNLAESSEHQPVLEQMRDALREHMLQSRDLGLVPEIELWRLSEGTTPLAWAATEAFDPEKLLDAAALVGSDDFEAIGRGLDDPDASVRYWAAVSCSAADELPKSIAEQLVAHFDDASLAVQIEVAGAALHHSARKQTANPKATTTLVGLLDHRDQTVVLHAARTIELLGDPANREAMQRLADRFRDEPGDIAWFIRFSTSGYLARLD